MGPSAIRSAGLEERLEPRRTRCATSATSDRRSPRRRRSRTSAPASCPRSRGHASASPRTSPRRHRARVPLVLGGDHSVALGTLGGLASAHGPGGVLWIDAHADINTPETSPSGNVHGMPLAAALGLAGPSSRATRGRSRRCDRERVALIGTRQLDDGRAAAARDAGVRVYTMSEIDRVGIERAVRESLDRVAGGGFVHVSLDMDVLDPAVAPGVGTPVRGGLTYREAHLALELVAESGLAGSLEVVEVNPILDRENTTALTAVELVASALGKTIYLIPANGEHDCARPGTSSDPSSATYFASRRSAPSRQRVALHLGQALEEVESIRDRSLTASHHSSSEPARQRSGTSSSTSTRRPASATRRRSSSGSARRNGPGAFGSGRSDETELERRPAGCRHPVVLIRGRPDREHRAPTDLSTRAISARARAGSGTSMIPKRQRHRRPSRREGRSPKHPRSGTRRSRPRARPRGAERRRPSRERHPSRAGARPARAARLR